MRGLFRILTIAGVWLLLCVGCTKKIYVPVESVSYHTDTLRMGTQRVDSIWLRDSVSVVMRGDTVYHTVYRDRYRYRTLSDTVYQARVDSVQVPQICEVEKIREVERRRSAPEKVLLIVGGLALMAVIIRLALYLKSKLP